MSKVACLTRYGKQILASRSLLFSQSLYSTSTSAATFSRHSRIKSFSTLQRDGLEFDRYAEVAVETEPSDEYYEGHLLTDQLEYIDGIMDKAVEIEESIDRLQTLYTKKKDVALNGQWMDAAEVEALFQESEKQKKIIRELVSNVKELSSEVKGRLGAVDAPDGTSDDMVQKDMEAVDAIIFQAWEQQKRDELAIKVKANCHSRR